MGKEVIDMRTTLILFYLIMSMRYTESGTSGGVPIAVKEKSQIATKITPFLSKLSNRPRREFWGHKGDTS